MLVLFDHGTPSGIAPALVGHTVVEARERGWDKLSNGGFAECRGGGRLPSTAHDRQEYPVSAKPGWPQDLRFGACELAVAGSAFASRQHCYRGERGKARRLHRSGDSQAISPATGLLRTSYIAGRLASATCVGSSGGFAGRILCFEILVCLLLESSMSLA